VLGFDREEDQDRRARDAELLAYAEPEDLIKYGLIPELVGRLPVVTCLQDLDREAMIRILQEPRNSLIRQYQKLMDMEEVELVFTQDAIEAVADQAIVRKTGARGLRSILEYVMRDVMYDVPSMEGVRKVVINSDTVTGAAGPELVIADDSSADVKGA